MVSGYSDTPLVAYGPRNVPTRVLDAEHFVKSIENHIPPEFRDILREIVAEEIEDRQERSKSLQRHDKRFGYGKTGKDSRRRRQWLLASWLSFAFAP